VKRGEVVDIDATPLDIGHTPTISDVFAQRAVVATGSGYLVSRKERGVRILRQSDLGEVASIPASGVQAASLVGNLLLLKDGATLRRAKRRRLRVSPETRTSPGAAIPPSNPHIRHLLGFDGHILYYSAQYDYSHAALGFATFDGSGPAPLPFSEPAESMVETDRALVMGLPGELVTIQPQCE
jgi:hypothetical protein